MQVRSLGHEDPLEKEMATHSSGLNPGESHGQRSLAGHSAKDCKESITTKHAHLIYLFVCLSSFILANFNDIIWYTCYFKYMSVQCECHSLRLSKKNKNYK